MTYQNWKYSDEFRNSSHIEYSNKPRAESSLIPRLYIMPLAKEKLDHYIDIAPGEISGLGLIEKLGQCYLIRDVFLLEQEATAGSSDLDSKAVAKLQFELMKKGVSTDRLKLWWHSHANMTSFWSSRDDQTIETFTPNWMISIVGNKNGDWCTRIDVFDPVRCTVHGLSFELYVESTDGLREELEAEVKAKLRKPAPIVTGYPGGYHRGEHAPWRRHHGLDDIDYFDGYGGAYYGGYGTHGVAVGEDYVPSKYPFTAIGDGESWRKPEQQKPESSKQPESKESSPSSNSGDSSTSLIKKMQQK